MSLPHDPEKDAAILAVQQQRSDDDHHYTMRISRRTVDKLGVKLYDRASAVVAELVANAYDADAELVQVRLPLATLLGNQLSVSRADEETDNPERETSVERAPFPSQSEEMFDLGQKQNVSGEAVALPTIEVIEVSDNGHGMDPAEADSKFLTVGQDRRTNPDQGCSVPGQGSAGHGSQGNRETGTVRNLQAHGGSVGRRRENCRWLRHVTLHIGLR